jgi:hypothetical protein
MTSKDNLSTALMFRIISLLILFLLLSCSSDKKPDDDLLIPEEKLVPVLIDLHLVYALQTTHEFRILVNQYDSIDIHSEIFSKHNITKAQLDTTLSYLSKNPEDLLDIYDEIIMQLSQMQDSIKTFEH